jgi:ankyrin repeat protein
MNLQKFLSKMGQSKEGIVKMNKEMGKQQIEREYELSKMGDELLEATRLGDTGKVVELIASGVDVNVQDEHGMTPISIAGSRDDKEIFRTLYASGADVYIRDDYGWIPFMHISANGPLLHEEYSDIMDDVDIKKAEKMGNMELAKELKRAKGEKMYWEDMQILASEMEEKQKRQDFPLHYAAEDGDIEKVKELIKKEFNVNAKAEYDQTPVHIAAGKGYKEIAELLIKAGADIHAQTENGNSTLHFAGSKEVAELLIKAGMDVNEKSDDFRSTPLHKAAKSGNTEVVEVLLKAGADIHAKDYAHRTPLEIAQGGISRNRREVAELIMSHLEKEKREAMKDKAIVAPQLVQENQAQYQRSFLEKNKELHVKNEDAVKKVQSNGFRMKF